MLRAARGPFSSEQIATGSSMERQPMQLTYFKVTKYRNVWESGWIDVGSITAFVGQNEAGKSNLFEALYRINPSRPAKPTTSTRTGPSMIGATKTRLPLSARQKSRSHPQRSNLCMTTLRTRSPEPVLKRAGNPRGCGRKMSRSPTELDFNRFTVLQRGTDLRSRKEGSLPRTSLRSRSMPGPKKHVPKLCSFELRP